MENSVKVITKIRPFLRGRFHEAAFFYSLGASTLLVAMASDAKARWAALIYGVCLAGLFGISSLYQICWYQKDYNLLRRLDHAMIFVFIAGTVTPICILGLPEKTGTILLLLFWGTAILGALKELFWLKGPKWVSAVLYVGMGWLAGPYISEFLESLGLLSTSFLIVGGVIYTVGAAIYALKWPNPYPKVFGYHEIFHILVMIASVFHFIVIYRLIAA